MVEIVQYPAPSQEEQVRLWADMLFHGGEELLSSDDVSEILRKADDREILELTDLPGQMNFNLQELHLALPICEAVSGELGYIQFVTAKIKAQVYEINGIRCTVSFIPSFDDQSSVEITPRVVPHFTENTDPEFRAELEELALDEAAKAVAESGGTMTQEIGILSFEMPNKIN